MSAESTALLTNALKIPLGEREEFAAALWESLDAESGLADHTDDELLAETTKRRAEIKSGTAKTITHAELKTELGR